MDQEQLEIENKTKDIKLYSSRVISGATFLGGPLVAGYLIGENFKALQKPKEGRNSVILGIVATILIFAGIFMIPDDIIENIPRQIIPLVYTAIIWGLVEWKQGAVLKSHKENNNSFFSGWRAAGFGFISLIVMTIGIFGYAYFSVDDAVYDQYNAEVAVFSENEAQTLAFYDHLNTETNYTLLKELDDLVIPKWEENIKIIQSTNQLEDLPSDLVEQNKKLLKYAELKVEAFQLFRKAIKEDTDEYSDQLDVIHKEIDQVIDALNNDS